MKQRDPPAPQPNVGSSFPLDHIRDVGIDKLKLALPGKHMDDALIEFIEERLSDLEKEGAKRHSVKALAFRNCLSARVGEGYLRIEWSPNRAVHPYWLTIEFNPNRYLRAGTEAVRELASFFRLVFGIDTARIMEQAVISRMDINIDYDINVLEGTLVSVKGKSGGANVIRGFDGEGTLATLYVGILGSDRRLTIYDKAAETLRRELKPKASVILAALASPKGWQLEVKKLKDKEKAFPNHWRMEVRCQRKGGYLLSQITELASSFDGVQMLHLPPDRAPFNESLGRTFIGHARHVGIPVALKALDDNDRRRMQRAISKLERVEWFNPEILREHIKVAIEQLAPVFRAPDRSCMPGQGRRVTMRPLPAKRPLTVPDRGAAAGNASTQAVRVVTKTAARPVMKSDPPANRLVAKPRPPGPSGCKPRVNRIV